MKSGELSLSAERLSAFQGLCSIKLLSFFVCITRITVRVTSTKSGLLFT